jgi:hypothetical protein
MKDPNAPVYFIVGLIAFIAVLILWGMLELSSCQ